jgi:hypothetical protein
MLTSGASVFACLALVVKDAPVCVDETMSLRASREKKQQRFFFFTGPDNFNILNVLLEKLKYFHGHLVNVSSVMVRFFFIFQNGLIC